MGDSAASSGRAAYGYERSVAVMNDGVTVAYSRTYRSDQELEMGCRGVRLVLIHGWSGSGRYWNLAVPELLEEGEGPLSSDVIQEIIVPDLRGHGDSGSSEHSAHVARLAMDLHDLILRLFFVGGVRRDPDDAIVLVGASMGAAVIWSFVELFGAEAVADGNRRLLDAVVTVDQAPLQYRAPDWTLGSTGCDTPEALARLQASLVADFRAFARANAEACVTDACVADACVTNEDGEEYTSVLREAEAETLRCDPAWLGRLMVRLARSSARACAAQLNSRGPNSTRADPHRPADATHATRPPPQADHTQLDWRPLLRRWPRG